MKIIRQGSRRTGLDSNLKHLKQTTSLQLLPYRTVTVWCIPSVISKCRYLGTTAGWHKDTPP